MNIEEYMQRAISLAETYRYTAKPNPMVGAILLKDKTIIAEGAHELFGSNHAEVNVIESAKKKLVIIEVQTGTKFLESDIKRYSDIYGRNY